MRTLLTVSLCKSCGKKVHFVKDENHKIQILDAVAPVWIQGEDDGGPMVTRVSAYVTHFATCPNATQHSKKRDNL